MRQSHLSHRFVEFIPEQLEEGVLYISRRYRTAAHKCCCGCGEEVITPLTPTDWSLRMDGNDVTLHPSIGNWSFACRSHYLIQRNKVVWAGQMSQQQIERGRARDHAAKQAYFNAASSNKTHTPPSPTRVSSQADAPGEPYSLWAILKRWWNS